MNQILHFYKVYAIKKVYAINIDVLKRVFHLIGLSTALNFAHWNFGGSIVAIEDGRTRAESLAVDDFIELESDRILPLPSLTCL
jgi:hypothetical protein